MLGSDLVEWLYAHVEGFADRRDAKKYANNLLKAGFIRHTVNKITFSEQCYYVFGDLGQRTSLPLEPQQPIFHPMYNLIAYFNVLFSF